VEGEVVALEERERPETTDDDDDDCPSLRLFVDPGVVTTSVDFKADEDDCCVKRDAPGSGAVKRE
jgi:hypothetical protein